ncbi:MAG: L-histidine N(alpha)-methyltransferase, partial [bacterium]
MADYLHRTENLVEDVTAGLTSSPKQLPCKLFYDERGSRLFERITMLDEYYPTRTEVAIMEECAGEMAALVGPRAMVIEYGSGSSSKTRILLDHLETPSAYVPIDISRDHLLRSAAGIAAAYPRLDVLPVCADYNETFRIPESINPVSRRVVYFPGSTIGNFHPDEAIEFLKTIAGKLGSGG